MCPAYAFSNIECHLDGPWVALQLGAGSSNSEGGITVTPTGDTNTMTIGADGTAMHSLHSDKSGTVTIRLLKTSPANAVLMDVYYRQRSSPGNWAQNVIHIKDLGRGDDISCLDVAFARVADIGYSRDGGEMVWTFHASKITMILGTGYAPLTFTEGTEEFIVTGTVTA